MIKIKDVVKLLKAGYVARDRNGDIYWYSRQPKVSGTIWEADRRCACESFKDFGCLQDIEPWCEDWRESLIEVGENK